MFPFPRHDSRLASRWHCTGFAVLKCVHTWCIKNFSSCVLQPNEMMESLAIRVGPNDELTFRLQLYPRGADLYRYYQDFLTEDHNRVAVFLGLASSKLEVRSVYVKYKITFENKEEYILKSLESKKRFRVGRYYGWFDFVARKALFDQSNECLLDDQLVVRCAITAAVNDEFFSREIPSFALKLPPRRLLEDISAMYDQQKCCNFAVEVQEKVFRVHKSLLSARSPVFAAMFQHNMLENNQGGVQIKDFDAETIAMMLYFVYGGNKYSMDKKMAGKVLAVANKYGLDFLKNICEDQLSVFIHLESVLETLIISENHSAKRLREKCLWFISCFADRILNSSECASLLAAQPYILDVLAEAITFSSTERDSAY